MKTATELAKMVGHEPNADPWWEPISDIKFNNADGAANRKTPLTMGHMQSDNETKTKEEHVEATFFNVFGSVFCKAAEGGSHWLDTHKKFYLRRPTATASGLAPDATSFDRLQPGEPDPRLIVGIHDNKIPRLGKFTHDDRGKLIRYLGIVMEHYQDDRKEIGGSLFDGQYAQCFRLERRNNGGWLLHSSTVFDCQNELPAKLFAGFLCSKQANGWRTDGVPAFCGSLLGVGSIGRVFAHNSHPAVVKVARLSGSSWLMKERSNLREMQENGVDSQGRIRLSDLDTDDAGFLILEPPLELMSWPSRLHADLSRVAELVEGPVKALHDKGWVHCDLRPDNIMEEPVSKQLWLVDFGAARRCSDILHYEHGTLTFASQKVRKSFYAKTTLQISAADDLESLVYVAYAMMALSETEIRGLRMKKSKVGELEEFWKQSLELDKWKLLLSRARSSNHAGVAEGLRALNLALPAVKEED
jgi:hypothetical protein